LSRKTKNKKQKIVKYKNQTNKQTNNNKRILKGREGQWWWCTPLISTLRSQKQADLCKEASLIYRPSFRTLRNPVMKNTPPPQKKSNKRRKDCLWVCGGVCL
jgi:hypothetical protein